MTTTDKPVHLKYPLETQIAELQRELRMRAQVYPRFVASRKITQDQAIERVDIMETTLALLEWLLRNEEFALRSD